ncbi:MAG: glycosyltransferase [Candidatus Micrarchaeaceae archaeon]
MESLNIAFYTDTYLPAVDGVVSSMLNFKKELERRGHSVYIFTSGNPGRKFGKDVFVFPGVKFKPYPQYSIAVFPFSSSSKLKSLSIDMIHAQTPFVMGFAGLLAAKFGRYPIASTFHTMINNKSVIEQYYPRNKGLKRFTKKYLWMYTKFFYTKSNLTIAPTDVIERYLRKHGIANTAVVPNSVDLSKFNCKADGGSVRRRLGIGSKEKMVLYLGRISKEKRLEVMLKACRILAKRGRKVRFVLGGKGPAEEYYKELALKLGIAGQVEFLGFVAQERLPQLYAAADAFCMPSTFETQGIVCLEAMASGKPVVGANFLALKDLIKNGKNGEKFHPGDYTACANKIERVLNNPEAYRKNAINTAKEFSVEKATDRLLDAYNFVLSKWAM